MRELGMWDSGDGIDVAFADIEGLSCACRYADCTHTAEPGCAVLRALADGTLDAARLASYRKLKTENDELRRKLEHMNEIFANVQRARFGQSSEKTAMFCTTRPVFSMRRKKGKIPKRRNRHRIPFWSLSMSGRSAVRLRC